MIMNVALQIFFTWLGLVAATAIIGAATAHNDKIQSILIPAVVIEMLGGIVVFVGWVWTL